MRGFLAGLSIGILSVVVVVQGLAHHKPGHVAGHGGQVRHGDVHRGHGEVRHHGHKKGHKKARHCGHGEKVRAAIDIGSSGPSIRVACIRPAEAGKFNKYQIVGDPLYEDDRDVTYSTVLKDFQADIAKRIAKGQEPCAHPEFDQFRGLMALAKRYHPREYRAAATAAFRSPQGAYFIDRLNICFPHLNAKVADQPMEGRLEYRAVANVLKLAEATAETDVPMVWGIGSTSVQLTFVGRDPKTKELKISVFDGGSGGTKFQGEIAAYRKAQCPANPVTDEEIDKCKRAAGPAHPVSEAERKKFSEDVESDVEGLPIPKELRDAVSGNQVVGLGGGHLFLAVTKDKDTKVYEANAVTDALGIFIGMNEVDLVDKNKGGQRVFKDGKAHPATVSTLVMVEGTMKALGIEEVKVVKTDLADGLLVMESW